MHNTSKTSNKNNYSIKPIKPEKICDTATTLKKY